MIRGAWRPRSCHTCGDPLEEWKAPLEPGQYVGCYRCGLLYVVDVEAPDTLTRVILKLEAPELQVVFEELVRAWWTKQGAGRQLAVDVGGATERKVA